MTAVREKKPLTEKWKLFSDWRNSQATEVLGAKETIKYQKQKKTAGQETKFKTFKKRP